MSLASERLIGREVELATLTEVVERAIAGAGRLVLLSGEPGIGKTRLAEAIVRDAEARGCRTAWGGSWEGPGTPAYWPWLEALRQLGLELAAPGAEARDEHEARFRLFEAVAGQLDACARQAPLVIVLDDLHAADTSTLLLLRFVARSVRRSRLAIVATSRDNWFHTKPETSELLAKIAREALHLPLGRLGLDDVTRWLAEAAPHLSGDVDRLFEASEGNPLFVGELVAAARKRPDATWTTPAALPLGVREAVRAHLDLLSAPAARLLETASVHGRELAIEAIAGEPAVQQLIDEAVGLGIANRVAGGRLRFAHVLLRDELYARLAPERRAELHRGIAAAATDAMVAAHHHVLGADPAHAAAAGHAVLAALADANRRFAFEDAAQLGERALGALAPHLPPADECELRIRVGESCLLSGRNAAGHAMCARAADLAAGLGDGLQVGRAAVTAALVTKLGRNQPTVDLLRKGLAALPAGDSTVRAQIMARLAIGLIPPAPHEASEMIQMRTGSIEMARRLDDPLTLFDALRLAAYVFPETMPVEARAAFYAEALQLADRLGRTAHAVSLFGSGVNCHLEQGDVEAARRQVAYAESRLAELQPQYHWRAPLLHATIDNLTGDFAAGEAHLREALRLARDHDAFEGLLMFGIGWTVRAYNRDDDEGLAEFFALAERTQTQTGASGPYHSIMYAAAYDAARTGPLLDRARNIPLEVLPGSAGLAWAALRTGLDDHARYFYQVGRQHFPRIALTFSPTGTLGPNTLLLGRLAALAGEPREAEAHYAKALALCETLRARPYLAQTQLAWARLLAAQGQPDAARTRADAAYRIADALGMRRVASAAAALCDSSAPAPRPAQPTVPAPPPPTPAGSALQVGRRGELWTLAAGGEPILLKDSKGLAYLEMLMRDPGREIHVLDLVGSEHDGDAGPMLDARAKQTYRARAEELQDDLEEATRNNDLGRVDRARAELEAIGDELARAVGLGGRDRRAASQAERARINVQRRLRDVIKRTGEIDAGLAQHLEHSVKTGVFCSYVPVWPPRA